MILVQATPEMSSERDRATHEAWGGPLAVERYQALERRLRGHGWSREVLRGWLLCAEGGEVLSSCETYRMPSRIEGAPGHSYAIASVYTEPDKRRKGYAAELLSRLGECLAGTGDAQAMILFSDVALRQMARNYPQTESDFARISGVGEKKLREFGEIFLGDIAAYLQTNARQIFADDSFTAPAAPPAPEPEQG